MTRPLTPKDCDVRGYSFMPLDVVRLLDSDFFALSTGDEFKAAVALWCRSWCQVPAASLPNDDRVLAHLSFVGARWCKVRKKALYGWVLCDDGRLYHPVIAEKANSAWRQRQSQRGRAQSRWKKEDRGKDGEESEESRPVFASRADAAAMPEQYRGNAGAYAAALPEESGCTAGAYPTAMQEKEKGKEKEKEKGREEKTPHLPSEDVSPRNRDAVRLHAKNGHRLPPDWQPSQELISYATERGLDPNRVTEGFRDYWHSKAGKDAAKQDWDATWRGWCRREVDWRRGQGGAQRPGKPKTAQQQWFDIEDQAAAEAATHIQETAFDLDGEAEELPN